MISTAHSTAALIPAFNAGDSLPELLRLLKPFGFAMIVVVDDGSTDDTKDVIPPDEVVVLRHERNRGKGVALQSGFSFLRRRPEINFILTMDADLQHRPEDIETFFHVEKETGADLIIGHRMRMGTGMPVARMVSNTLTSGMVSLRTGVKILDSQCGFRLIRRSLADRILCESTGYEAETEFLIKAARAKCRIAFAPVRTVYAGEKSSMRHWQTTVNFIRVLFRDYE